MLADVGDRVAELLLDLHEVEVDVAEGEQAAVADAREHRQLAAVGVGEELRDLLVGSGLDARATMTPRLKIEAVRGFPDRDRGP